MDTKKEIVFDFDRTVFPKELSYFLGFLWADGYNHCGRSTISLEIVSEDMLDVQWIFKKIYPVNIHERKRDGRKPQSIFYITSKEFSKFLESFGKYPKTNESHKKIIEYIPEDYRRYFIRGFFDGDGCFYKGKNCGQVYFSGPYGQDWRFLLKYLKELGFSFKEKSEMAWNGNKSSYIRCTKAKEIRKFVSWLYKGDDEIFLRRKREKGLEILKSNIGSERDTLKKKKEEKILSFIKESNKNLCQKDLIEIFGDCRCSLKSLEKEGKISAHKEGNKKIFVYE